MSQARSNRRVLVVVSLVVATMGAMAYASVPLYKKFCQVTGFGGTTQRADAAPGQASQRVITVRFNADVNPGLPWKFRPEQPSVDVHPGEPTLAQFEAINLSSGPVTGQATFNVTPAKAGIYFDKTQCFCFTEQTLKAGERVDMPVSFFVDPKIAEDPNLDDVKTITLSYSFFRSKADAQKPVATN
jgi:cytochrome c oxidase assembly protein subunit 11